MKKFKVNPKYLEIEFWKTHCLQSKTQYKTYEVIEFSLDGFYIKNDYKKTIQFAWEYLEIFFNVIEMKNKVKGISGIVESQKQTFDALLLKYNNLNEIFEVVLRKHVAAAELRDLYRQEAGCKRNIFIDLQNNVTDLENKNRLLEQRNKDMQLMINVLTPTKPLKKVNKPDITLNDYMKRDKHNCSNCGWSNEKGIGCDCDKSCTNYLKPTQWKPKVICKYCNDNWCGHPKYEDKKCFGLNTKCKYYKKK